MAIASLVSVGLVFCGSDRDSGEPTGTAPADDVDTAAALNDATATCSLA